MEKEQMIGKQSVLFHNAVHILSGASMAGKKEGEGPLGKYFDKSGEDAAKRSGINGNQKSGTF